MPSSGRCTDSWGCGSTCAWSASNCTATRTRTSPARPSSSTSAPASTRRETPSWPPTTPTSPNSTRRPSGSGAAAMAADRTAPARDSEQAIAAALQRYRVMANVVGVLLIALVIIAVPLKYFADMPTPVTVLGTAHGWLYALFFLSAVDLGLRAKWSLKGAALTILAGTIPFLSFVAEHTVTRKMRAGERV